MAAAFNKPNANDTAEALARVNLRYPNKKTMNLLPPEQVQTDYRSALIAGIVLTLLVFAFAKFAVFDRYAAVSTKQAELDAVRAEVVHVQKGLDGYNTLEQEYQSYAGMNASSDGTPDALAITDMVHRVLGTDDKMTSLTMSGAQLRIKLDGYSLKQIGELTERFKQQKAVKKIAVSTANTDSSDETGATATLTISLADDTASKSATTSTGTR